MTVRRPAPKITEDFGYEYFDDPEGHGYRGYGLTATGDGDYLPWAAARKFCQDNKVVSAVDVGCAKGFLVAELLDAGVDAVGYDVSTYALSFATGLPCYRADLRAGIPKKAEAIFALGVLVYLSEEELTTVLADLRNKATRFLLISGFYDGEEQEVPDPLRLITKTYEWWRATFAEAGFTFSSRGEWFDVYTV